MSPCHGEDRQFKSDPGRHYASVAQLVEQRTENPCVPGSIPGGTTPPFIRAVLIESALFLCPFFFCRKL